MPLDNVSKNK